MLFRETKPDNFVFLASDLPQVGPEYKWNNYDKGYEEYGNYITQAESETTKKSAFADLGGSTQVESDLASHLEAILTLLIRFVNRSVEVAGFAPAEPWMRSQVPHSSTPTPNSAYQKKGELVNENDSLLSKLIGPAYAKDNDITQLTTYNLQPTTIFYPFRSLFSGRKQEELEFNVKDYADYFSFTAKIPQDLTGGKLIIPAITQEDVREFNSQDLSIYTDRYPEVLLDGEIIQTPPPRGNPWIPAAPEVSSTQPVIPEASISLPYIKKGNLEIKVPKINGYYSSQLSALNNQSPKSCDQFNTGDISNENINENGKDYLRLTSLGSSNCLDFDLPNLTQKISYLVSVENRNIEGKSLLFSVINKNSQRSDIETYLPKGFSGTSYFILPPMEEFGRGYNLHFDNISIGRVKTVNDLGKITVNPIPYRFLTGMKIVNNQITNNREQITDNIDEVVHPNPSYYQISLSNSPEVSLPQSNNTTLILSQAYDKGWKAYEMSCQLPVISCQIKKSFPFLFGKEIKDRVMVNNWENGWNLQPTTYNLQPTTIIIIYLPQYLEYLGFGLLGIALFTILRRTPRSSA